MATFVKRRILLCLDWSKVTESTISYYARCWFVQPDDHKDDGEEELTIRTPTLTLTRNQFRNLSGQDMEDAALLEIDLALQELGTGAGTHTLQNDFGS